MNFFFFLFFFYSIKYFLTNSLKKKKGSIDIKGTTCASSDLGNVNKKKTNAGILFSIEAAARTFFIYTDTEQEFRLWKEKLIAQGAKWKGEMKKQPEQTTKTLVPDKNDQDVTSVYDLGEEIGRSLFFFFLFFFNNFFFKKIIIVEHSVELEKQFIKKLEKN